MEFKGSQPSGSLNVLVSVKNTSTENSRNTQQVPGHTRMAWGIPETQVTGHTTDTNN